MYKDKTKMSLKFQMTCKVSNIYKFIFHLFRSPSPITLGSFLTWKWWKSGKASTGIAKDHSDELDAWKLAVKRQSTDANGTQWQFTKHN